MARAGFYSDNAQRRLPFLEERPEPFPLPDDAIVDFGCWLNTDVGFDPALHHVYLWRVRNHGGEVSFEFLSDCPGLADLVLRFWRQLDAEEYATDFAEATPLSWRSSSSYASSAEPSASSEGGGCDIPPVWEGYLATGNILSVLEAMGGQEEWIDSDGDWRIEPALVCDLSGHSSHSVLTANAARLRAPPPADCPNPDGLVSDTGTICPHSRCAQGDLAFREGYNVGIVQSVRENRLRFSAGVGAGQGTPCEEVVTCEGEAPPTGRTTLDGALRCSEVIRSINGVRGSRLRIEAGPGVTVSVDAETGHLVVDFDLGEFNVCRESSIGG